jgi:DNA-binding ferritin-like protein
LTTTEQSSSREQAIRQVLHEFAKRPDRSNGFKHDELIARVAELGHAEPPTVEEVLAEQERAMGDQHKDAHAWLERAVEWLDRHIAEARERAEDLGEEGDVLHLCVFASEIETHRESLRRLARMMQDIVIREEMGL